MRSGRSPKAKSVEILRQRRKTRRVKRGRSPKAKSVEILRQRRKTRRVRHWERRR